jgi:dTDP-4-dehydrorhamnose 3,5-epimerase
MIFRDTAIPGVLVIEPEPIEDERGFFARLWSAEEMIARGLAGGLDHCSLSFNRRKGTLRGLHYQLPPFDETKIVRCTQGAIYDVAVDLRRDSRSFRRWAAAELTAANRRMLYIPRGCAHGFQTLAPDAEVTYFIEGRYSPSHARGVRWNDPAFGIEWPDDERTMNERDRSYPDFGG